LVSHETNSIAIESPAKHKCVLNSHFRRVLVAIAWGFGAALAITIIPLLESKDEIYGILNGIYCWMTGKEPIESADELAHDKFAADDSEDTPLKEPDEEAPAATKTATSATKLLSSSVKAVPVEIDDGDEVEA